MNAAEHRTRQSLVWFELCDLVIIGMSPACSLSLSAALHERVARQAPSTPVSWSRHFVSRRIFATNEACPDLQAARSGSGRPDCSCLVVL
jgi:hypothetical protein